MRRTVEGSLLEGTRSDHGCRLRKPAKASIERLYFWRSSERKQQWVGEARLDVLDESRANASSLELRMDYDIH
jgi:hypothetical protein